jgi:uracil-DNA glycosylase
VSDDQTRANRPLTVKEIKDCIPRLKEKIDLMSPDKIVALGKTAKMALTLLRLEFFAMEHPSGLNRKLNNKDYVEEKISGLREYLTHNLEFISND